MKQILLVIVCIKLSTCYNLKLTHFKLNDQIFVWEPFLNVVWEWQTIQINILFNLNKIKIILFLVPTNM